MLLASLSFRFKCKVFIYSRQFRIWYLNFSSAIKREMECLQILSSACAMFVIGRKRRLHLFSGETHGAPRYGVLRIEKEGKANYISSHVPSYRDANGIMGRYKVLSRWSRCFRRYVQIDYNASNFFSF